MRCWREGGRERGTVGTKQQEVRERESGNSDLETGSETEVEDAKGGLRDGGGEFVECGTGDRNT